MTPFAGYIGFSIPTFTAYFTPCVEIGWRIAAARWGRGYATEGARAALMCGFETLNMARVVSFTVPADLPSRRVMEKIGMVHDLADDSVTFSTGLTGRRSRAGRGPGCRVPRWCSVHQTRVPSAGVPGAADIRSVDKRSDLSSRHRATVTGGAKRLSRALSRTHPARGTRTRPLLRRRLPPG
jgi:hypothetical protein